MCNGRFAVGEVGSLLCGCSIKGALCYVVMKVGRRVGTHSTGRPLTPGVVEPQRRPFDRMQMINTVHKGAVRVIAALMGLVTSSVLYIQCGSGQVFRGTFYGYGDTQ